MAQYMPSTLSLEGALEDLLQYVSTVKTCEDRPGVWRVMPGVFEFLEWELSAAWNRKAQGRCCFGHLRFSSKFHTNQGSYRAQRRPEDWTKKSYNVHPRKLTWNMKERVLEEPALPTAYFQVL